MERGGSTGRFNVESGFSSKTSFDPDSGDDGDGDGGVLPMCLAGGYVVRPSRKDGQKMKKKRKKAEVDALKKASRNWPRP